MAAARRKAEEDSKAAADAVARATAEAEARRLEELEAQMAKKLDVSGPANESILAAAQSLADVVNSMKHDPNSPLGVLVQMSMDIADLLAEMAQHAAQKQKAPLVAGGRSVAEKYVTHSLQGEEHWHSGQSHRRLHGRSTLPTRCAEQLRCGAEFLDPAKNHLRS